jgi:D-alanyl-D-alanine carboxypeptidase
MNSPPVPPLIHGGRRRRRYGARLALLCLLVAPLAVAGAAYLAFAANGSEHSPRPDSIAVGPAPAPKVRALPPPAPPPVEVAAVPDVPLTGVDAFHVRLRKPPRAALVFDVKTGEVLWRLRPLRRLPIASLTKIMTALVVTERTRPSEPVRITNAALRYTGSGVGLLPRGKRVRLETLLNGLLIVSGNDAAIALADHVSGTERRFVRLMNRQALRWRLRCTHFASSHGLESGNRSCPRDLAVLTRMAMSRKRIRRIVRRPQVAFRFPIKGHRLFLTGHNPLMRAGYRGTIGLKTGYTDPAGLCFVGVVRRGGHTLGVVLLHSANPTKHAERLLDAAFRYEASRGG